MIIDSLRGGFVGGNFNQMVPTSYGSFTVNNAVTVVYTDTAAPVSYRTLVGAGTVYRFANADYLCLLSVCLSLGYQFCLADGWADIQLVYGNNAGCAAVPEIGSGSGRLQLPIVGGEVSLGVQIPWRRYTGGSAVMSIGYRVINVAVSMVNVPAALNGLVIYPVLVAKVSHVVDMLP